MTRGAGIAICMLLAWLAVTGSPTRSAAQTARPDFLSVTVDADNRVQMAFLLPAGGFVPTQVIYNTTGAIRSNANVLVYDAPPGEEFGTLWQWTIGVTAGGGTSARPLPRPGTYYIQLVGFWPIPDSLTSTTDRIAYADAHPCPNGPRYTIGNGCYSPIYRLDVIRDATPVPQPPAPPAAEQPQPQPPLVNPPANTGGVPAELEAPAAPNTLLQPRGTFQTGTNARSIQLDLAGSKVRLSANSAIYQDDEGAQAFKQTAGRLFFDIRAKTWRLKVLGPAGDVTYSVRGTSFDSELRADGTAVLTVYEGTVEVESGGVTVSVRAGRRWFGTPGQPARAPGGGAQINGMPPVWGGITLVILPRGIVMQTLLTELGSLGCSRTTAAFWATDGSGGFVTYVPGATVAVVNDAWNQRYGGNLTADLPILLRCF